MDFKAQLEADMSIFHNVGEMADLMDVYYGNDSYTIPVLIDYTQVSERKIIASDHVQGINETDAVAYMALSDIGKIPKRDMDIEIGTSETGYKTFRIVKSSCEAGEIILELAELNE